MKYKPTEKQLRFLNWEFGAFFHFGIRSFNPGHSDWDEKDMPVETFNPDNLNCEQWIKAVKAAGAKYAILTAKHHDGFANWPSEYTNYSVAHSPWKSGSGDVVKEFVSACRKYVIATGLYYSPAQWGQSAVSFSNPKEYDDYFINQITELLTNYGKIDYLWFDGCGSDNHKYDEKRIIKVIRTLQPDIIIFCMWDPDVLWVGNEDGYCTLPNSNVHTEKVFGKNKTTFFPYECDCKLRDTWFYDFNEDTIKSVDELVGMYELSVGHGANLLLNIGPDNHGQLCNDDVQRLAQFKDEIDKRYSSKLNFDTIKQENENCYSIEYSEEYQNRIAYTKNTELVRSVIIEEDITNGNAVKSFRIYAHSASLNPVSETKYCIYTGETIGHKAICRFPAVRTPKLTLEIVDSEENPLIKNITAFG